MCAVCACRDKGLSLQDLCFLRDFRVSFQCNRCQQSFSTKGQIVSISGFAGHVASVPVIQIHACIVSTAIHSTCMNEYAHGHMKCRKNRREPDVGHGPVCQLPPTWSCKCRDQSSSARNQVSIMGVAQSQRWLSYRGCIIHSQVQKASLTASVSKCHCASRVPGVRGDIVKELRPSSEEPTGHWHSVLAYT